MLAGFSVRHKGSNEIGRAVAANTAFMGMGQVPELQPPHLTAVRPHVERKGAAERIRDAEIRSSFLIIFRESENQLLRR